MRFVGRPGIIGPISKRSVTVADQNAPAVNPRRDGPALRSEGAQRGQEPGNNETPGDRSSIDDPRAPVICCNGVCVKTVVVLIEESRRDHFITSIHLQRPKLAIVITPSPEGDGFSGDA
jgi:hypothetical protein